tara:strand:- start:870 stop:1151 length:282 start_codon:yes stop_codon:yes gene_type:complete
MISIDVDAEVIKVTKYLDKKQAWDYGYIRYSVYRKMIVNITKHTKLYFIRKIFLKMIELNLFIKQKTNKRSYMYKYRNPNEAKVETKSITINF